MCRLMPNLQRCTRTCASQVEDKLRWLVAEQNVLERARSEADVLKSAIAVRCKPPPRVVSPRPAAALLRLALPLPGGKGPTKQSNECRPGHVGGSVPPACRFDRACS